MYSAEALAIIFDYEQVSCKGFPIFDWLETDCRTRMCVIQFSNALLEYLNDFLLVVSSCLILGMCFGRCIFII